MAPSFQQHNLVSKPKISKYNVQSTFDDYVSITLSPMIIED